MFPRTLESLKPLCNTKLQHGQILTLGFGSKSIRPWPILNRDHHQCLIPLYVPHRLHGVLEQVSGHLSLMTYLSTRRWKKNHWAGQGTFEDRHAKEEELYPPPSSRSELSRQRPGVSARHFSQREPSLFMSRETHTKIYRPSPRSLQDER